MIFTLTGPSGVGKSTLAEMILKKRPDIHRVVTYTTRKKRPKEKNGVHYHFVTHEEIQKLYDDGKLVELTKVHDNWYATPLKPFRDAENGDYHILLHIDIVGVQKIKAFFKDSPWLITIWIEPEIPEKLVERIRNRNAETEEELKIRMKSMKKEMAMKHICDVSVINWEGKKKRTFKDLLTVLDEHITLHPYGKNG